jgi:hypothetical protein
MNKGHNQYPGAKRRRQVFFRDIFRTSVIEKFVEISTKNAPMIRDLEAVDQLVTPQVLRLAPINCDAWI